MMRLLSYIVIALLLVAGNVYWFNNDRQVLLTWNGYTPTTLEDAQVLFCKRNPEICRKSAESIKSLGPDEVCIDSANSQTDLDRKLICEIENKKKNNLANLIRYSLERQISADIDDETNNFFTNNLASQNLFISAAVYLTSGVMFLFLFVNIAKTIFSRALLIATSLGKKLKLSGGPSTANASVMRYFRDFVYSKKLKDAEREVSALNMLRGQGIISEQEYLNRKDIIKAKFK
jgi:hypothetical protein